MLIYNNYTLLYNIEYNIIIYIIRFSSLTYTNTHAYYPYKTF